MTEEEVSEGLFLAASSDPNIIVLTWHAVDGKSYFTPSVKLRHPGGTRVEPDLILLVCEDSVWLIEVKADHSEAVADERKLVRLRQEVGDQELLVQITRRSGHRVDGAIRLAVAYAQDDPGIGDCEPSVVHIHWPTFQNEVAVAGLGGLLSSL